MKNLKIRTYGKINLYLEVTGKRENGYHELEMVMQNVNLYDEIYLEELEVNRIVLTSDSQYIPKDESNIAAQAAAVIKERFDLDRGVKIHIRKNIPVAAGLAGGSGNAAGVLKGLNSLWELGLSTRELQELGLNLGADVPFQVMGGAAVARGIGENLTAIKGLKNTWIVLSKPALSVSTPEVYGELNVEQLPEKPIQKEFIEAVEKRDLHYVSNNMYNALESVTLIKHPVIEEIKRKMMQYNAMGSMMSGSGPTVFGIFKNQEKAKKAAYHLGRFHRQTFVVNTYNGK